MADFTPDIADDVLATIRDGNEEVAGAFSRALDGELSVAAGDAVPIIDDALPEEWHGPGLVVAFAVGELGALLLLPEASGLLPDWCAEPDTSKLATLAQELGIVLLPEAFAAGRSKTAYAGKLSDSFQECEPAESVTAVPITLTRGEQSGTAHLVWPIQKPLAETSDADVAEEADTTDNAPAVTAPSPEDQPTPVSAAPETPLQPPGQRIQYTDLDDGIRQLPTYAKSLLKVEVPVTVRLATTKQSVDQILKLGPGSILQFDKRCEENLELEIGGQTVAEGEVVKVGDKFGLWITAMTVPEERFWVVNGKRTGTRVQ